MNALFQMSFFGIFPTQYRVSKSVWNYNFCWVLTLFCKWNMWTAFFSPRGWVPAPRERPGEKIKSVWHKKSIVWKYWGPKKKWFVVWLLSRQECLLRIKYGIHERAPLCGYVSEHLMYFWKWHSFFWKYYLLVLCFNAVLQITLFRNIFNGILTGS